MSRSALGSALHQTFQLKAPGLAGVVLCDTVKTPSKNHTGRGKKRKQRKGRDCERSCDLNLVSDQTHSAETSDRRVLTSSGSSAANTVTVNGCMQLAYLSTKAAR